MQDVDFGRTALEYRRFRAGFPDRFFDELQKRGIARAGNHALDLGTGTGTVARGLTGLGLRVIGLDPAAKLVAEARELDRAVGLDVTYVVGRAEALGFSEASFELVTAGQCWHWFDRAVAAKEVARVLKLGGRLVIAHFDWLPLPGHVVEATEELIVEHNPSWTMHGGTGLYPEWLRDMVAAGFSNLETFSFDTEQIYSHRAWRGRIRASAGVRASLDERRTEAFDRALAALLRSRFPEDPLVIPHRVWAVFGTRP